VGKAKLTEKAAKDCRESVDDDGDGEDEEATKMKKTKVRNVESGWPRGMSHTALYFYGAAKKSLHKPQAIFWNMLLQINYGFS
jgi:hypothetical protein